MADVETVEVKLPDESFMDELGARWGGEPEDAVTEFLDQAAAQYQEASELLEADPDTVELELPADTIERMENARMEFSTPDDEFRVDEMLTMILTALYVRMHDSAAPR